MLSIADRDKPWLEALATALAHAGYRFMATSGTADALRELGHEVTVVSRVAGEAGELEGQPTIVDAIAGGRVSLVVNTPSPTSGPVRDAAAIRHAAVAEGILCLTTIETAVEAARSLDPAVRERMGDVRTLQEWRSLVAVPA
jgi:carbamoyl-phosphate synthase large subunit